jgi:hypothetical protein
VNEQLLSELKAKSSNTHTEYFDGRGNVTSTSFDYRKFAELIIWECYQWARENGGISCPVDYSALNEHFGIK